MAYETMFGQGYFRPLHFERDRWPNAYEAMEQSRDAAAICAMRNRLSDLERRVQELEERKGNK